MRIIQILITARLCSSTDPSVAASISREQKMKDSNARYGKIRFPFQRGWKCIQLLMFNLPFTPFKQKSSDAFVLIPLSLTFHL